MRKVTGEFLRREVNPRVPDVMITVTEVRVSDDLHYAAVYCSIHGNEDRKKDAIRQILKAAKRMRSEVAEMIRMKKLPEFRFVWDDTLDRADRIEQLLNKIHDSQSPPDEESGGPS